MSGLGRPGTGVLKVDGKEVKSITMPKTLPMILQWDESFDIGSDTLTGVNDADYKPPFTLTAKLNKLTIKVDRRSSRPRTSRSSKRYEEAPTRSKRFDCERAGRPVIRARPATSLSETTPIKEKTNDKNAFLNIMRRSSRR